LELLRPCIAAVSEIKKFKDFFLTFLFFQSVPKKAEPVQLLNLASGNKSDILYNEAAVRNLFLNPKLADRNVVVFSIIGAFRKGKSFLMNYVLRYMYAHVSSHVQLIREIVCYLQSFTVQIGVKRPTH
jgi:c-di-AMP phosphodiesterase-like protein